MPHQMGPGWSRMIPHQMSTECLQNPSSPRLYLQSINVPAHLTSQEDTHTKHMVSLARRRTRVGAWSPPEQCAPRLALRGAIVSSENSPPSYVHLGAATPRRPLRAQLSAERSPRSYHLLGMMSSQAPFPTIILYLARC